MEKSPKVAPQWQEQQQQQLNVIIRVSPTYVYIP